jgi:hypothetical protein
MRAPCVTLSMSEDGTPISMLAPDEPLEGGDL